MPFLGVNDKTDWKTDRFPARQKDQLFDDWMAFAKKHRRCPKPEEVTELSERAFEKRRAILISEDATHPHLSILEEPLDAVQVKNLVNNEKRRRSKLAQYPAGLSGSQDVLGDEDGEEDAALVASQKRPAVGFIPFKPTKKQTDSETDSHSTLVASLAGLQGFESDSSLFHGGNVAVTTPTDHILSAALTACQQVLTAQRETGAGLDLQMLQEKLQQALAMQLQNMSPQQQLALWQLQQQQQQQTQQQSLQQALGAVLAQQPGLAQALQQLPGLQNPVQVQQNTLLSSLSGLLGQQQNHLQPQNQFQLGGFNLQGVGQSLMTNNPTTSFVQSNAVHSSQPQPTLSQVMQLMQLMHQ